MTVKEALNSEKAKEWEESIKEEANNFLKRQSWKKISRKEVTKMGRKIIKCKTILKTKVEADKTCRFKTRMTIQGDIFTRGDRNFYKNGNKNLFIRSRRVTRKQRHQIQDRHD